MIKATEKLEDDYDRASKKFPEIMEKMTAEIKSYLERTVNHDCEEFKVKSFGSLHDYIGFADLTSFVPLIVHTVTLYHCLLSTLCINMSSEPLAIQLAPLYSGTTSVAAQLLMMQKTATHYMVIQERIGPNQPNRSGPNLEMSDTVTTLKESPEKDHIPDSARQMVDKGALALSTRDQFEARGSNYGTFIKPETPLKTPNAPSIGMLQCQRSISPGLSKLMQGASLMGFGSTSPVSMATGTDADADDVEPTPGPESPKGLSTKRAWTEPEIIELSSNKDTKGQGKTAPKDKKDLKCKKASGGDGAAMPGTVTVTDDGESFDKKTSPQKAACSPEELAKQLGCCIDKWSKDLPALQLYRESNGLTAEDPELQSNRSHVPYLESQLSNKDLGPNICSIDSWRKELEKKVDLWQSRSRQNLAHLNTMAEVSILHDYESRPLYLVEAFVWPVTKEKVLPKNVNGWGQDHMPGLYGHFVANAIDRITTTDTGWEHVKGTKKDSVTEAFCGFCKYLVGKHLSINNHLRMHLHLALVCCLGSCFHIEVSANEMWNHGVKVHGIEKGKAAIRSNKLTIHVTKG